MRLLGVVHSRRAILLIAAILTLTTGVVLKGTNKVGATDLPVVYVSGTLSTDTRWTAGNVYVSSGVTVPDGITLTIDAGAIVKAGAYVNAITVTGSGTLHVEGISGNNVVFTSAKDDSYGGDSNNDGSSAPSANDYSSAIAANGGTVGIQHATFKYAQTAIINGDPSLDLSVTDSSFSDLSYGLYINAANNLLLQRNAFNLNTTSGIAAVIKNLSNVTGISLSGSDKNAFAGNASNISVSVSSSTVPLDSTWSISTAQSGAILRTSGQLTVNGTLDIADDSKFVLDTYQPWVAGITVNGTVHIGAGAILKFSNNYYGFMVQDGGHLDVNGTASSPTVFTSYKDDSHGGDANNDGLSYGSVNDYGSAVTFGGADITVDHASFAYGSYLISGGSGSAAIAVSDSVFTNANRGLDINRASSLSLVRNDFVLSGNSEGLSVSNVSDLSGIVLNGSETNLFSGSLPGRTVSIDHSGLPSLAAWSVSGQDSGVIFKSAGSNIIDGTLDIEGGTLVVVKAPLSYLSSMTVNGTLNVGAGSVLKYEPTAGILGGDTSTININGTPANGVVFTSIKDDSVAGDTNQNGTSSGISNDYQGAINANGELNISYSTINYAQYPLQIVGSIVMDHVGVTHSSIGLYADGTVNASHFTIDDVSTGVVADSSAVVNVLDNSSISSASYGLQVSGAAQVTFRGSITSISAKGILACRWNENCRVDASYVDWGNVDGPNPAGGALVCGQVIAIPYRYESTTYNGASTPLFQANCDSSDIPADLLNSNIASFEDSFANNQIDCGNGFQDACAAIDTEMSCLTSAVNIAGSLSPIPIPTVDSHGDISGFSAALEDASRGFIIGQATEALTPEEAAAHLGTISTLVGTFISLGNAYSNCK
jgi:hypothetical protein